MRPTAKDLAIEAGVSLATIDRVLNGRPGVRPRTIIKVNEAIERIGFVRNLAAVNLARKTNYQFRFLLPETGDQFLDVLIGHIEEARKPFAEEMADIAAVRLPVEDPYKLAAYLGRLDADTTQGIAIMAPESPQVRDAINRLLERGIEVVQFIAGQPKAGSNDFVGINNHAAGATAAQLIGRFSAGKKGKILVVSETMQARDSIERRLGFDEVLNREYPELQALPSVETHADTARTGRIFQNIFANHPDVSGLYVMSAEARVPVGEISKVATKPLVKIVHERTPFTEAALLNGDIDAVIAQNSGHLVRSAIRILKARNDQRPPLASQEKIRIEILIKENL
ncbi:LacI family DNA-binding transcriptional regulator [Hoeflea sp.]|uniref:LacI family DNA-binding transcriptional regulator n=1 Tax=Hoeflea sp. TaxID=1940281 RepID=UPI0019BACE0E|nr:LacI family DNA-binding transcriptional regulator [Hoeflea sp.]MBC7282218.1 LacI family DNA-binding transcriptional regulator [Hoeflea sp.]